MAIKKKGEEEINVNRRLVTTNASLPDSILCIYHHIARPRMRDVPSQTSSNSNINLNLKQQLSQDKLMPLHRDPEPIRVRRA